MLLDCNQVKYKKILFYICLFLGYCSNSIYAQRDSLLNLYKSAHTEKERINALKALSIFFVQLERDLDEGKKYTNQLMELAQEQQDTNLLILSYDLMGTVLDFQNKSDEAIIEYKKSLEYLEHKPNYQLIAKIYYNMGLSYGNINDDENNYLCSLKALEASQKCDCPEIKASVKSSLSFFYSQILTDYQTSLFWAKEAYKDTKKVEDLNNCQALYNISSIFLELNMPDSAKYYVDLMAECNLSNNDVYFKVFSLVLKSSLARTMGNYQEALNFAELSNSMALQIQEEEAIIESIKVKAEAFLALKRNKEAVALFKEALGIVEQSEMKSKFGSLILDINENLFKATVESSPKEASEYLKKSQKYQSELNKKAFYTKAAIFAAENYYTLDKAEKNRLQLLAEKEIQKNRFISIAVVFFIIFSLIMSWVYMNTTKKNVELNRLNLLIESQNKDLSSANLSMEHFTYTLSHDALGYINHILNFSVIANDTANLSDTKFAIKKIQRNASNLKKMAKNLIEINHKMSKPDLLEVSLLELVSEVIDDMESELLENGVILNIGILPNVLTNRESLKQVFRNLLGNAIKFRRPDVVLELSISASKSSNNLLEILVSDNGQGIAQDKLPVMFKEFVKGNKNAEGSGLGLYISRQIIENMGGSIWAESKDCEGSTFHFTLLPTK